MSMAWVEPVTLQAPGLRLEPLSMAHEDGLIRGHALRRDGCSLRDTVMYCMRGGEWSEARAQLLHRLERHIPLSKQAKPC